ncbi:MAG TPA: CbtA family protein, partial [Methylovirgula sp.]
TAFGGLFALVFAFAYGRVSGLGPRTVSALLALTGLICLYIVPNLKYPSNPPSVGHPDTIGIRTGLYFAMMVLSVGAMVGAAILRKRLAPKHGAWTAALVASGAYIVAVIVAAALLPPINEVPSDFPAVVLWHFRIDSLAMQAIMWATLGFVFGALTERDSVGRLHRFSGNANPAWR